MKIELIAAFAVMTLAGCAFQEKQVEQSLAQPHPINCATAEGDIRVLQSEKSHVAGQVAAGATAIVPAGMVVGIVTGTELTKLRVATGEYNKKIDERVAAIKRTCKV
jgi:hypothetical protein